MVNSTCEEWLKFSRADLNAAEVLMQQHKKSIEIILYHCQQAAEKALKAFLVNNGIRPDKIRQSPHA